MATFNYDDWRKLRICPMDALWVTMREEVIVEGEPTNVFNDYRFYYPEADSSWNLAPIVQQSTIVGFRLTISAIFGYNNFEELTPTFIALMTGACIAGSLLLRPLPEQQGGGIQQLNFPGTAPILVTQESAEFRPRLKIDISEVYSIHDFTAGTLNFDQTDAGWDIPP